MTNIFSAKTFLGGGWGGVGNIGPRCRNKPVIILGLQMGETIQEFAIISCGTIMKTFIPLLLQMGGENTGHGHHLMKNNNHKDYCAIQKPKEAPQNLAALIGQL